MKAKRTMQNPKEKQKMDPDALRARREEAKQQLRGLRSDGGHGPKKTPETKKEQHIESREHKSAPTVMSSRRPVSRARTVVQPVQPSKGRDPRFDSLSAGPVNLDLLSKSYKFLPELYEKELKSLKSMDRVSVVSGDVSQPHLGLSEEDWTKLAETVDLIVHASGKADHLIGYQGIAPVNTYSTREVLRLASDKKVKAVANIGSTNMWLSFTAEPKTDEVVMEDLDLDTLKTGLFNGYSQSKWVSEMLTRRMHERGVPAMTVRPGVLGGSASGRYHPNEDSFLWRLYKGCAELGLAPRSKSVFTETPADWFSEIFGKLVASPKTWTSNYDVFHIRNEAPLDLQDIPAPPGLKQPEMVAYDDWVDAFQKEAAKPNSTNPLAPLRGFVAKGEFAQLPQFDQTHTKEVLGDLWTEPPAYRFEL